MMLKKLLPIEKKGIKYGMLSPIFYSIDSVLDILLFAVVFNISYQNNLTIWQTIFYSFITSFFKDFLLYLYLNIKTRKNILKLLFKTAKTKRRAFWWTVIGSISGGPLGFTLTTATILYSGAAYGSALSNFSPIIVLLFAKVFFKTKLNFKSWIGVVLTISGFLGISFYSSFINDNGFHFNLRVFIGVIMAILAVITWSAETIIIEYVEKFGKEQSLDYNEKFTIKSIMSSSSVLFVFLPIALLLSYISNQEKLIFSMVGTIFNSWKGWIILLSIGITIVIGRFFYWYAISHVGGGRADILYYLTILLTPLLVLFLHLMNVPGFYKPSGITSWIYWLLLFIKMSGIFLVTINTKNSKEYIYKKN